MADASSTADPATTPAGSIIAASVSSIDALDSLSSAGFGISIPTKDDDGDVENSPVFSSAVADYEDEEKSQQVLESVVAAHEEEEAEEEAEEASPAAAKESKAEAAKPVDENVFASAGLAYNKDKGRKQKQKIFLLSVNLKKGMLT